MAVPSVLNHDRGTSRLAEPLTSNTGRRWDPGRQSLDQMVEMSSHIPQNLILGNSNHSFRCQMDSTERIAISDLET